MPFFHRKKNIIETSGLGRSKLSLDNPGVSLKVDFWSESFKRSRKCSSNLFACNLIAGCSNENKENCLLKVFEQRNKKKSGLKFTPELALIGVRTTGPYAHMKLLRVQCAKHFLPVYISTFFFRFIWQKKNIYIYIYIYIFVDYTFNLL